MSADTLVDSSKIEELNEYGLTVIPSVIPIDTVGVLRQELENAIEENKRKYPDVFDRGMVHNCMIRGEQMAILLDHPVLDAYLSEALSPTCIIYAYQSSSLPPGQKNYGSRLHVDSPRFIPGYTTNLGVIFALDDFTESNGATFYLKGSHKIPDLPNDEYFFKNASRGCCKAGDMILFNGRLVHAAGENHTNRARHSLTINVCRSYMRQRFDFPRLVDKHIIDKLGVSGKRLIGMNVRMPSSLEEFYLPEDQRLYKSNQG